MAASADRLDELLADARAQGRPSVSISPGLAAELLGHMPDPAYWAGRELDGWSVDAGRVITFTPIVEDSSEPDGIDQDDAEVTALRLTIAWVRPAQVAAGAGIFRRTESGAVCFGETPDVTAVEGDDVRVADVVHIGGDARALTDPRLRRLALLAAEIDQDPGGGAVGGGSGI